MDLIVDKKIAFIDSLCKIDDKTKAEMKETIYSEQKKINNIKNIKIDVVNITSKIEFLQKFLLPGSKHYENYPGLKVFYNSYIRDCSNQQIDLISYFFYYIKNISQYESCNEKIAEDIYNFICTEEIDNDMILDLTQKNDLTEKQDFDNKKKYVDDIQNIFTSLSVNSKKHIRNINDIKLSEFLELLNKFIDSLVPQYESDEPFDSSFNYSSIVQDFAGEESKVLCNQRNENDVIREKNLEIWHKNKSVLKKIVEELNKKMLSNMFIDKSYVFKFNNVLFNDIDELNNTTGYGNYVLYTSINTPTLNDIELEINNTEKNALRAKYKKVDNILIPNKFKNLNENNNIEILDMSPIDVCLKFKGTYIYSGSSINLGNRTESGIFNNESKLFLVSSLPISLGNVPDFPFSKNTCVYIPNVIIYVKTDTYESYPIDKVENINVIFTPIKIYLNIENNESLKYAKDEIYMFYNNVVLLCIYLGKEILIFDDMGITDYNIKLKEIYGVVIKEIIEKYGRYFKKIMFCLESHDIREMFKSYLK